MNLDDNESVRKFAMEHLDVLDRCGFKKPAYYLEVKDKDQIIRTICLHKLILSCLGELCSLKDGMKTLGVLDSLTKHSYILEDFFCIDSNISITSGTQYLFIKLLQVYSMQTN